MPIDDPILVFTVLALTMLVAPILAERLRIPDLVILLLAGMLLGMNGLGVLRRDAAVEVFGSVGLLYIMFLAGLEIDLHRFRSTRSRSVIFGLLTFIIPQGLGAIAARYILGIDWLTAILLASMFASHTLLAYPLASRMGISRHEPVSVTVGATILTDTLALLVLAVIVDIKRGESVGVGFWLGIGGGMLALVALILWCIPLLTRWFFGAVTERGGAQFLFVLVTVCGFSYLSHFAKMEPIIGAFLAGVAFSRLIPEHSVLMNRVVFAGNTLFIPFFLISVGMLVDLKALAQDRRGWLVAATMVGCVVVTKFAAAWVAGALFGYDRDSRRVMFGLSVVQAAATLAAVLVGFREGIFDESVLNGAIAMIVVTCPLGSWMVDRYGRALAARPVTRERTVRIDQRILVPVSKPESATRLLDLAFLVRNPVLPGGIHPVTIVRDSDDLDEDVARAEKLLAHCLSHAASGDFEVTPSVRVDVNMSDGIVRAAKELRTNVVMAGWASDHGVRARIFGTVMENLLEECPARLFICRLVRPLNTVERVLILFAPLAERRTDLGVLIRDMKHLTRQIGARLTVCLCGGDTDELRTMVEKAHPTCPCEFFETPSVARGREWLVSEIGANDLVLLPAYRRSGVLWTPSLDRMPEEFAARFPEQNLLVVYPALVEADTEGVGDEDASPGDGPIAVAVSLRGCEGLDAALRRMADAAFPEESAVADEAHRLLSASASSYPVELSGGAALIHAHCAVSSGAVLLVGADNGTWDLPGMKAPVRVLVALVSPVDEAPECHLRRLAELARRFLDPAFADRVAGAPDAEAVAALLAEA